MRCVFSSLLSFREFSSIDLGQFVSEVLIQFFFLMFGAYHIWHFFHFVKIRIFLAISPRCSACCSLCPYRLFSLCTMGHMMMAYTLLMPSTFLL